VTRSPLVRMAREPVFEYHFQRPPGKPELRPRPACRVVHRAEADVPTPLARKSRRRSSIAFVFAWTSAKSRYGSHRTASRSDALVLAAAVEVHVVAQAEPVVRLRDAGEHGPRADLSQGAGSNWPTYRSQEQEDDIEAGMWQGGTW